MDRPRTPPPSREAAPASRRPPSPPTPEVTRRMEENRLLSKAIRDQNEAAARASGASTLPHKTSSGFVATDDIHVVGTKSSNSNSNSNSAPPNNRKRPHSALSSNSGGGGVTHSEVPASNRDARTTPTKPGEEAPLRPARNFAKYVDYNFSAMTDTKGGFLTAEDDPHNFALSGGGGAANKKGGKGGKGGEDHPEKPLNMSAEEWERKQLLRRLQRQKAGPFEPGMSALEEKGTRKKCRECGTLEIDVVWEDVFHVCVCNKCKEKIPEKYSLLTKTEVKQDYLLTDPELKDADLLPHLSKPNPHKAHWHDMMLFLRCQVEEYAFTTKWGSAEALDAEFEKRESDKRRRKEAKFQEKLRDLKRKTRTDAYRRQTKAGQAAMGIGGGKTATRFGDRIVDGVGGGPHVHEWGRPLENSETGMSVKTCMGCGMEVEEIEF